jgi:hypothetical protein
MDRSRLEVPSSGEGYVVFPDYGKRQTIIRGVDDSLFPVHPLRIGFGGNDVKEEGVQEG